MGSLIGFPFFTLIPMSFLAFVSILAAFYYGGAAVAILIGRSIDE